jgi:hypothetical protein
MDLRAWIDRVREGCRSLDIPEERISELLESHPTQQELESILMQLARELDYALCFKAILAKTAQFSVVPSHTFWKGAILGSRDEELGLKILDCLVPYINVTDFICDLLQGVPTCTPAEQRRICLTTWAACCGASFDVSTKDQFMFRECLDKRRVQKQIERVHSFLGGQDVETLEKCLDCLR